MRISASAQLSKVREEICRDEMLQAISRAIASGEWDDELRDFKPFKADLRFADGLLFRGCQIVIPAKLRSQAMENAHIGHPGVVAMKRVIRDRLWWPGINKQVQLLVARCQGCVAVSKGEPPEPMSRTKLSKAPMELVAVDFYSSEFLFSRRFWL